MDRINQIYLRTFELPWPGSDKAGVPERRGCPLPVVPKEVKEKFSGALEGIYFATGSARILEKPTASAAVHSPADSPYRPRLAAMSE